MTVLPSLGCNVPPLDENNLNACCLHASLSRLSASFVRSLKSIMFEKEKQTHENNYQNALMMK